MLTFGLHMCVCVYRDSVTDSVFHLLMCLLQMCCRWHVGEVIRTNVNGCRCRLYRCKNSLKHLVCIMTCFNGIFIIATKSKPLACRFDVFAVKQYVVTNSQVCCMFLLLIILWWCACCHCKQSLCVILCFQLIRIN